MDRKLIYLCDPEKNRECRKSGCFRIGGPCSYTTDPKYAAEGSEPEDQRELLRAKWRKEMERDAGV